MNSELDCTSLAGRLRQICEGTSGLSPETEEAYRQLWRASPPFHPSSSIQADFTCIHRTAQVRTEECALCGGRVGDVPVYGCALHGECTVSAHGIRRGGQSTTPKVEVCIACEDRISVNSAF